MKKSILLLLTTLLVLPLWAQSRYSVYKIKGAVQICPKGQNTWAEPARKQDLQLGDRLQLGQQSAITIFDSSNSLLYTYEKTGECTVMEAVRSVRNQAGARTSAVNAEMKRSIQGHGSDPAYGALGASFRGQGEASYTDSLSASLHQLAVSQPKESQLSLDLISDEDAAVFKVSNKSNIPLYINVLRINGQDLTVCLEFNGKDGEEGILLSAGAHAVLDQYPFVPQDGARYVVFGTARCYDTRSLQRDLKRGNSQNPLTSGFIY